MSTHTTLPYSLLSSSLSLSIPLIASTLVITLYYSYKLDILMIIVILVVFSIINVFLYESLHHYNLNTNLNSLSNQYLLMLMESIMFIGIYWLYTNLIYRYHPRLISDLIGYINLMNLVWISISLEGGLVISIGMGNDISMVLCGLV